MLVSDSRSSRSPSVAERQREPFEASADLETVGAEIAERVRMLDGLVLHRFGDNAELMGRT
jgi:hypothetical protein